MAMKEFVISEAQVETAVLVGLITKTQDERKTNEYLDELAFLAETAGAEVVKRFTQKLDQANSVTYVGKGKRQTDTQHRRRTEGEDSGPYVAHPRHLRHACTDGQRQDAGRTGTVQVHVAPSSTPLDAP